MATAVKKRNVVEGEVLVPKRGFGRPTKLDDDLLDKAQAYVRQTGEFSYQLVPTIEGLSLALRVSRETIYKWVEDDVSEDFSDIVMELRSSQAEKLLQNALLGRYNPMIAKLMLSKHGYVEKSEVDNKHEMVQPIMKLEDTNALPGDDSDPQGQEA